MLAWFMAHFPNSILQLFGSAYFSRLGGNSYLSWIWLRSRHFDCDNYSTWYWTSWLISYVSHMNLDPTRQGAHQKKWYSSFDTVFFLASTQLGNWSGTRLQDITRYYQISRYEDMISLYITGWLLLITACTVCTLWKVCTTQWAEVTDFCASSCWVFFMFFHIFSSCSLVMLQNRWSIDHIGFLLAMTQFDQEYFPQIGMSWDVKNLFWKWTLDLYSFFTFVTSIYD